MNEVISTYFKINFVKSLSTSSSFRRSNEYQDFPDLTIYLENNFLAIYALDTLIEKNPNCIHDHQTPIAIVEIFVHCINKCILTTMCS